MDSIDRIVLEIVKSKKPSLDELREELESRGLYLDGRELRKVVAEMVRMGVLCKVWDPSRRRFRLHLCIELGTNERS